MRSLRGPTDDSVAHVAGGEPAAVGLGARHDDRLGLRQQTPPVAAGRWAPADARGATRLRKAALRVASAP